MGLSPFFLGFYFLQAKLKKDLQSSVFLQFQDISRTLEHSIDTILNDHKDNLDFLVSLPSFQDQLLEDWDKDSILRKLLLQFSLNNPLFEEVLVTKGTQKQLRYFSSTHPKRTTLKPPNNIQTSKSFSINFSKLLNTKVIKIYKSFIGQDGENHTLQASIRLSNLFKAILVLHRYNLENISQRKIILLDQNHSILFSSHSFKKQALLSSIKSITKDLGILKLDKVKYLYHRGEISQVKWKILILKEYKVAFDKIKKIERHFHTVALALSVFILLLGNFLATLLLKPIEQLIKLSKQISFGNLKQIKSINRSDEIGELAQSMNHMALSINTHQKHEKKLKIQLQESLDNIEVTINNRTNSYLKLIEEHQSLSKMLSHDMGNYLTNISLKFEEISSSLTSNEQLEINKLNQEAHSFLKKVLEFSSINEGYLEINLEKILISDFVQDIQTLFSNKLHQKSLILDTSKVDETLSIFVDREWFLFSVLNNIISNAIKFSNKGSSIILETITNKKEVILIILDHGVGIEKSRLSQIFDGGKKTSTLGTQGEVGSGFGLILVKKWIEKFNGKLNINSSTQINSSYTKVSIHLPLLIKKY